MTRYDIKIHNIVQTVSSMCIINLYRLVNIHCRYNKKDIFIHAYLQYVTSFIKSIFPFSLVRHLPICSNLVEGSDIFLLFSCLMLDILTNLC